MTVVAVLLGGLIGTAVRLGIDALIPHTASQFPLSTLLINLAGSFILGLLVARIWPAAPDWLRFGLGTGVLGSFTTFSAVMASLSTLAVFAPLLGLAYLAASLLGGLGAAWLGLRLGRHQPPTAIGADE